MIIDCISDLHGHFPALDGGDLLIVAGDLTAHDEAVEYIYLRDWLHSQDYKKKIIISGNHDNELELDHTFGLTPFVEIANYLCDSGTEFEGLKIWGSPWTKKFPGMNAHCKAFTVETEEELSQKWDMIPEDIDILITHCPPNGIFDSVKRGNKLELTGSVKLRNLVLSRQLSKLKLHVFGHIHEHGGKMIDTCLTKFVNASIMNEVYDPIHKPMRIIL